MNKTFVTSTLLSEIYDKTGKDYLALLLPFVEYILEKDFKVNDEIDIEKIKESLSSDFMFEDMPHNVVDSILNRIKKTKRIKKENHKIYLCHDYSGQVRTFIDNRKKIYEIIANSINKMMMYINDYLSTEYTYNEIEHYFSSFLTDYGYKTLFDHNTYNLIPSKRESLNFVIGKYIEQLSKDKTSPEFVDIIHILKGQMLTDAIYLQIDKKNKKHLENMNVYIDGPLMLRFLGLKSKYENLAAKELLSALKVNKVKLKIFQHTRDEIINILTAYSNRINESKYSTLEKFDNLRYSKEQVKIYISELDRTIKDFGFEIVEKPDFNEKYLIDEIKLRDKLSLPKSSFRYNSQQAVERDVQSVRSINILRKGQNHQTIEECNHIFITSYKYFKKVSNSIRNDSHTHIIGPVLTDLELATILWIKDTSLNDELPRMRLMEIAMAAQEPSNDLIDKTMDIINEMKKDVNFNDEKFSSRLTYQYLSEKDIKEKVNNDSTLITRELIEEVISKDTKEIEESKIIINEMAKEKRLTEQAQFKLIEQNGDMVFNDWNRRLLYLYYIITVIIIVSLVTLQLLDKLGLDLWVFLIVIIASLMPHIIDAISRDKGIRKHILRISKTKRQSYIEKQQIKLKLLKEEKYED